MADVNIVMLAGRLTRDPEVKYLPSGSAVADLGLAIGRKFKDGKTGELKEETTFVDITVFGRQAETVCQYQSKGGALLIEGRLRLDQWDDRETGKRRSKLKIIANRIQFLGGGSSSRKGGAKNSASGDRDHMVAASAVEGVSQSDIPF